MGMLQRVEEYFPAFTPLKWVGNFLSLYEKPVTEGARGGCWVWTSSEALVGPAWRHSGVGGALGKGAGAAWGTQDLSLGIWVIAGFLGPALTLWTAINTISAPVSLLDLMRRALRGLFNCHRFRRVSRCAGTQVDVKMFATCFSHKEGHMGLLTLLFLLLSGCFKSK